MTTKKDRVELSRMTEKEILTYASSVFPDLVKKYGITTAGAWSDSNFEDADYVLYLNRDDNIVVIKDCWDVEGQNGLLFFF